MGGGALWRACARLQCCEGERVTRPLGQLCIRASALLFLLLPCRVVYCGRRKWFGGFTVSSVDPVDLRSFPSPHYNPLMISFLHWDSPPLSPHRKPLRGRTCRPSRVRPFVRSALLVAPGSSCDIHFLQLPALLRSRGLSLD